MMNNNNAKQQYLSSDLGGNVLAFLYADEAVNFYSKSAFRSKCPPTPYTHSQTHTHTLQGWEGDIKIRLLKMLQSWFCLPQKLILITLIGSVFMIVNNRHLFSIKNDLCWNWEK